MVICAKCSSRNVVEYTSYDGQMIHCNNCGHDFDPAVTITIKTKKQRDQLEALIAIDRAVEFLESLGYVGGDIHDELKQAAETLKPNWIK